MNRREVITVLGCAAATWPLAARAQAPAALRIGLLSIGAVPERPVVWDSFFERMRELGYEDSQNIVYIRGFAAGHAEHMDAMIHEVVAAKPALLVVTGAVEARAVQRVNPPMPCVMFLAADPVGSGLVPSLARPGGRFTGLTTMDLTFEHAKNLAFRRPKKWPESALIRSPRRRAAEALEPIAAAEKREQPRLRGPQAT
jgi:putative ABC transport system substrate-binding protein